MSVLPLLHDALVTPGLVPLQSFLTGYGAEAETIPEPLFAVAAYLGARLTLWPNGVWGAAVALAGIFLPGLLVMAGALPSGIDFAGLRAQAAMRSVNAAVVELLAAALYDPLWKYAIVNWTDVALVMTGLGLLTVGKAPPLAVVVILVIAGNGRNAGLGRQRAGCKARSPPCPPNKSPRRWVQLIGLLAFDHPAPNQGSGDMPVSRIGAARSSASASVSR